jgi:hypothetical protein
MLGSFLILISLAYAQSDTLGDPLAAEVKQQKSSAPSAQSQTIKQPTIREKSTMGLKPAAGQKPDRVRQEKTISQKPKFISEARIRWSLGIHYSLYNDFTFNESITYQNGVKPARSAKLQAPSVPRLEIEARFLPRSRIGLTAGISYGLGSMNISGAQIGNKESSEAFNGNQFSSSFSSTLLYLNGAWRNSSSIYILGGINYPVMMSTSVSQYPLGTPNSVTPLVGVGFQGGIGYYFTPNLVLEGVLWYSRLGFKINYSVVGAEDSWQPGLLDSRAMSLKYVF